MTRVMVATIEKLLEQARDDSLIHVLCKEGCYGETFEIFVVGQEGRIACKTCGNVIITLHLKTMQEPSR